jgi:two-component system sensor histidine kinase SenX3
VSFLSIRIAPLDGDLILMLAEDRTTAVRVEETRRDFVANVSHELKTPIGAVALLAEAVEGAADDPEAVHRFAARLAIESQRLGDLVSQIIDLSRLQADDPLVQADLVDIDEVLAAAVDRCRVDAEKRDVQLTVAGERGCQVLGSERQLEAAIGNLVENAIIYSDPGARVAVAAHRVRRGDDEIIEITVSDNGIGIAQADLDRIFERFYRVDYARSRANGGTGLGLSIVKHIAAAHGGEVSVWSQLGQGSTFTVSIPAPAQDDRPAALGALPDTLTDGHRPATRAATRAPSDNRRRTAAEPSPRRTTETQESLR